MFEYNEYIRADISNKVGHRNALSVSLPLHESLVIASNGEEVSIIAVEGNSHDMLGVTSERNGQVTFSARISEDIDEAIIICDDDQGLILREAHIVDMSAISARREDTINEPSKLGGVCMPGGSNCV